MLPYLQDSQMNSQYEYDHQVYPSILARPPEQNDDSKTKYCPSLVENKTFHCIRYDHLKRGIVEDSCSSSPWYTTTNNNNWRYWTLLPLNMGGKCA